MREKVVIILLVIAALLDDLCSLVWGPDFTFQGFSVATHFCFCALMILVMHRKWLDRILISMVCGLISDILFTGSFPIYTLLYPMLGFFIGLFQDVTESSGKLSFLFVWISVFLVEWIPYVFFTFTKQIKVPFMTWFIHLELPTLLVHGLIIVFLFYVLTIMNRFIVIREHRQRIQEKKRYRKYKLSRK